MNEASLRLSEDLMLLQRRYNALVRSHESEIAELKSENARLSELLSRATRFEALSTTKKRHSKAAKV